MCVSSKSKRKDSDNRFLQFQALAISKSWGRGALPKAGETQLGLEARTFSQFIKTWCCSKWTRAHINNLEFASAAWIPFSK